MPPAARVVAPAEAETRFPLGAPVAQVLDTYVIAVAGDGDLVLVDQHAAHERLTHERLRAEHAAGAVRAQALLLPEVVELPPAQARALGEGAAALATLGLELEPFGAGAVLVRAVPALLGSASVAPLLRDVAEGLLAEGGGHSTARPARCGAGPDGLPWLDPRRAKAGSGRDVGAAARDGGDAAGGHLQPRPADLSQARARGDRTNVRPGIAARGTLLQEWARGSKVVVPPRQRTLANWRPVA